MYRMVDGRGCIEAFSSSARKLAKPQFRLAQSFELEGFMDWSPAVSLPEQSRISESTLC